MKHLKHFHIYFIAIFLIIIESTHGFVHIQLKKSTAKYRNDYLKNLKFTQIFSKNPQSSFLEEKDISLHQQVLAQKRLATFYGELNVGFGRYGDPAKTQSFKMLFDTGSCEFWIPSKECSTKRCVTHTQYTRSQTYKPYHNARMAIQYLSGKVEGEMALESIGLGDLIVPNQVIGIAKEVEIPLLDEVCWDGILGLAYPNKNLIKKNISPLFDNIINQNLLKNRGEKNQFAYYLGVDRGAITFGGADMKFKKSLDEEFKWAPIMEKNYWTITLLDIKKYRNRERMPSNNSASSQCMLGCKAIVDTGTYLIYGPSDQLNSFLSDMTLNSCEDRNSLPNIGFVFKGYNDEPFELILTPDDYVLEFDVNGKHDCVIGIGADNEDSGWTLGQVFLRAYYTVFDRESEAIGKYEYNLFRLC
jgi:cathepsin D